ncbi:unnamed protein product [Protopolystoma xenopodis]|uniref:Uncharacterized protein n=1 Tax=Protopolystoma xenopodis TaxID=117903 RepID=A0A3S5B9R2_9PLAT|nr:unnamed protein product [Protopolystoma xenopodis]
MHSFDGRDERCHMRKTGPHLYDCNYTPHKAGTHQVHIRYGGDHIMLSPFMVSLRIQKEGPSASYLKNTLPSRFG